MTGTSTRESRSRSIDLSRDDAGGLNKELSFGRVFQSSVPRSNRLLKRHISGSCCRKKEKSIYEMCYTHSCLNSTADIFRISVIQSIASLARSTYPSKEQTMQVSFILWSIGGRRLRRWTDNAVVNRRDRSGQGQKRLVGAVVAACTMDGAFVGGSAATPWSL